MVSKEELLERKEFAAYTTTFYGKDPSSVVRSALTLKSLENAEKLGVRCVVVDGGSNEEFLAAVRQFKNVELSVQPTLGMGESRREALRLAAKDPATSIFLWFEPEKEGLIRLDNLNRLIQPLRDGGVADIVVPARKEDGMNTLPPFQAKMEKMANEEAMDLIMGSGYVGEIWDLWFGPKIFNREGLPYFLNYQGELDKWDTILVPVGIAYREGKRIVQVFVDFLYDESQRKNEEGNAEFDKKRVYQRKEIIEEFRLQMEKFA
jgi:glycosyltransferase involved in cell wall biosynthesis